MRRCDSIEYISFCAFYGNRAKPATMYGESLSACSAPPRSKRCPPNQARHFDQDHELPHSLGRGRCSRLLRRLRSLETSKMPRRRGISPAVGLNGGPGISRTQANHRRRREFANVRVLWPMTGKCGAPASARSVLQASPADSLKQSLKRPCLPLFTSGTGAGRRS